MPRRETKPQASGAPKIGAWVVTFSDCMTLLLTFFVLLLTFSSFDPQKLHQLEGVIPGQEYTMFSDTTVRVPTSVVEPPSSVLGATDRGSETRTTDPPRIVREPRPPRHRLSNDAFRDLKVFSLPSAQMFHGRGTHLTSAGQACLGELARLVRLDGGLVIVAETGPDGADAELGLQRAGRLAGLLAAQGVERERLSIAAQPVGPSAEGIRRRVVQFALVAERVYRP